MKNAATLLCLMVSGAAALIYQICWIREASLVLGSTLLATSTVLAVFFLGLALGSEAFGRIAAGSRRPLAVFALLELGLAILGVFSLPAFDLVDELFGSLYRAAGPDSLLLLPARAVLVSLVVLGPAIAMGASLPLFCAHYVRSPPRIAAWVAGLYALNTLGAAAGCVAAGFWLIPLVGVKGAVLLAAACNTIAGLVVAGLHWRRTAAPPRPNASLASGPVGLVGALFFGTGFAGLGGEVLWTRFLALVVPSTVHTYTLTIATTLLGLVLGSAIAGLVADRLRSRALAFGTLQVTTGLVVLALMLLPAERWLALGAGSVPVAALLLAPALLSGLALPIGVRMVVDNPALAAVGVGRLVALNTAGGVAGALLVGFVLLPGPGLHASLLALTGLSLGIGFTAWLRLDTPPPSRGLVVATVAVASTWLCLPLALGSRVPDDFLGLTARVLAFREGATSTVAVVERDGRRQLEIDGWWQGQRAPNHQRIAAHLPMLLHPGPRSVLVVGVGTGQTARRFLYYDITRLDCVDLEPAVFPLVREYFDGEWLEDPRVRALTADGGSYLAHTAERYDVISLELGQVFRPGVAGFYTADFYRRARTRLSESGLLVQFLPLPFFDEEQLRRAVASFVEIFPASQLWYNTAELLLVGHRADRVDVDLERFELQRSAAPIRDDLTHAYGGRGARGLDRREVLLAGFLSGPRGLASLAAGRPVFRDDPPELEYSLLPLDRRETREIQLVEVLREVLDPVESVLGIPLGKGDSAMVQRLRDENLGEIVASALARRVEAEKHSLSLPQLREILEQALAADPEHGLTHRLMGDLQVLAGDVPEAEAHYRIALASRPRDPILRSGLAHALSRLDRFSEAAYHYREALEFDPSNPETHNNLGAVLAQQGRVEEAGPHFEEALRLRPDYEDARRNLRRARAIVD